MRTLILGALFACLPAGTLHARDTDGPSGPAPEKNFSNIHDETDWVMKAFSSADSAAKEGDWANAARLLQEVIDRKNSLESEGDAAPYVRRVTGTTVYEGAWIVARHQILRWGDKSLEAYRREYGATARALLTKAAGRRDTTMLAGVAARFLGLEEGRRAALLLVDLALERSDLDAAMGWIEALEDVEAVTAEDAAALAPWRAARIARHALVLARGPQVLADVRKALEGADPSDGFGIDAVPLNLTRRPAPPREWLTTGGNPARSAVPARLGSSFRLRWFKKPSRDDDLVDSVDPIRSEHDRPSLWLPPRAAVTREHLFVSDGQFLHIFDLDTGERLFNREAIRYPRMRDGGIGTDTAEDRRIRFGLLEGHALTLHPVNSFRTTGTNGRPVDLGAGYLVLCAVPDGSSWDWDRARTRAVKSRNDRIQAYHWNGTRIETLWSVGGYGTPSERGGLPTNTRLYGAPVVYAGRVWVAGVRPAKATQDRWESWVYSVDPRTGRVATRTHLGTGTPVRVGRVDEVIPTSPAAAHGRVVVGTSLGILAAVDARDGRVQWIYRYDRAVETERGRRRNRDSRDQGLRTTSFCNEPPILTMGRCFITPTDSHKVMVTFNRPRTRSRQLSSAKIDRIEAGDSFMPEQIAGVVAGSGKMPASLVLVGKGESGDPPGPLVAVWHALDRGLEWPQDKHKPKLREIWREPGMTGFGADPYGRGLVTEGEVFVPQAHGIGIFELADRDADLNFFLGILNRDDVPSAMRKEAPPTPYGNLVPVPGRGLIAVSATTIAFWERK